MLTVRLFTNILFTYEQCRTYSWKEDAEKLIPRNALDEKTPQLPQPNGPIVDKKPFKMSLKAGK